jgi:hypothetical protein
MLDLSLNLVHGERWGQPGEREVLYACLPERGRRFLPTPRQKLILKRRSQHPHKSSLRIRWLQVDKQYLRLLFPSNEAPDHPLATRLRAYHAREVLRFPLPRPPVVSTRLLAQPLRPKRCGKRSGCSKESGAHTTARQAVCLCSLSHAPSLSQTVEQVSEPLCFVSRGPFAARVLPIKSSRRESALRGQGLPSRVLKGLGVLRVSGHQLDQRARSARDL